MIPSRTIHKWIGIVTGIALLIWTVTGIIMVIPAPSSTPAPSAFDLSRVTVPPGAVLAALSAGDSVPAVRSLALVQILDRVLYQIETPGQTILVDASNGQRFEISADVAQAVARKRFRGTPGQVTVEHLTAHDARYKTGTLPAYRVSFGDAAGTVAYVSARTGTLVQDRRRGFRVVVRRLHDFSILKDVIPADWVHRGLAIGACLLAIGGIVTGYWLALPPPKRKTRVTEAMTMRP